MTSPINPNSNHPLEPGPSSSQPISPQEQTEVQFQVHQFIMLEGLEGDLNKATPAVRSLAEHALTNTYENFTGTDRSLRLDMLALLIRGGAEDPISPNPGILEGLLNQTSVAAENQNLLKLLPGAIMEVLAMTPQELNMQGLSPQELNRIPDSPLDQTNPAQVVMQFIYAASK